VEPLSVLQAVPVFLLAQEFQLQRGLLAVLLWLVQVASL
jgi:hypothetical protein